MKFFITESKLYDVVFKYLDSKNFFKIETHEDVYYSIGEEEEYAIIRFNLNPHGSWCFIDKDFVEEVSSFFSMNIKDVKNVISMWVRNDLKKDYGFIEDSLNYSVNKSTHMRIV